VAKTSRHDLLEVEAERITGALVERGALLVLAFGSFARGDTASASDLDIIAVIPSELPFIHRLEELYMAIVPRVGLDLLAYTPKEFEEMKDRLFVRRALQEGRVLYAA
jgi:predicted nucleotidyltransferase